MVKEEMAKIVIKTIDDNLLYRMSGVKQTRSGNLRKYTWEHGKIFCKSELQIHLSWKTQKLLPERLKQCHLKEIPIRVVQAPGNSYIFRITCKTQSV